MRILAIDPGRTSGICVLQVHTGGSKGFSVVTALEIQWESRFEMLATLVDGTFIDTFDKPQPPEIVVIESYRLRQGRAYEQSGSDFPSSQIIGIVQAFLWLDKKPKEVYDPTFPYMKIGRSYGLDRLTFQEPAIMSRVQIMDDDLNWVSGSEHKKDAYKHARFYYIAHLRNIFPLEEPV